MSVTRRGRYLLACLVILGSILSPPTAAGPVTRAAARRLSTAVPELSDFLYIRIDDVDNHMPAVAYNSLHDEYLVVWTNQLSATVDITAQRVRSDGTLLGSFTVVHNYGFANEEPDVAYSPVHDEYLIVYTYDSAVTQTDIWARRVKWDGSWMSGEFSVGRKPQIQHRPAVAYNPDADEYLVVYENTWGGGGQDIDAERVQASDGTPLGWMNIASGANQFRRSPDVVYSPASGKYLIAYTFRANSTSNPGEIYGKVASWNMGDLGSEISICADGNDQDNVSVAAGPDDYMVVWENRIAPTATQVHARLLDGDGTPLGDSCGFEVAAGPDRHDRTPQVASTAAYGYLVTWENTGPTSSGTDVYGRYVRPGHDPSMDPEFAIDQGAGNQTNIAVSCSPSGDCLMVDSDDCCYGGDWELFGRFVIPLHHRVYAPLILSD